ncbi:MAG: exodeoxyribonuclease VII small subunit [Phycisphaerales bacterium]|jgi:exodeoxyribonuclease VII small subunit
MPNASKPAVPSASAEALTYEEAVAQLEAILAKIESGEIGLEASIQEYERGVGLIKRCRAILDQAEQRIEHLDAKRLEAEGGA